METAALSKDNPHHSNSNVVPKLVESAIKIDSISIDLINANEKGLIAEKCEHFSIRGFVSHIRKKDWKICSPFASGDENDKPREQDCPLPPLDVPKFRFWHCRNCLQEIGVNVTAKDIGPLLKFCNTALKSNNTCSHTPSPLSNFQQIPNAGILEKINAGVDASAAGNETSDNPSSGVNKKGTKNEAGNGTIRGRALVSKENLGHGAHTSTSVASDVNPVSPKTMQKTCHKNGKDVILNCNGSTDECQPAARYQEATVSDDFAGNLNDLIKHSSQIKETGKGTSKCFHNVETPPEGTNSVKEVHDTDKVHHCEPLSRELDEHDSASSDNAEIPVGNKYQDFHHDNLGGTHRKKVRKVRLLTDLLCENGEEDTNNMKTEDSVSNANPDESAVVHKLPPSQSQLAIQGNARRCLGSSKKRKLSQDDDWRPPDMTSPNKVSSAVRNSMKDSESADANIVSEPEDDVLATGSLHGGSKNNMPKRRIDKSPLTGKNKEKKVVIVDECLSLEPSQAIMPIEAENTTSNSPKGKAGDVSLKFGISESIGREIDFFPLSAPRTERKLSFSNKKSKIHKCHDLQPPVNPWNHGMLGESIITKKDMHTMRAGPVIIPFCSVEDASGDKGLNLSLNSYAATQSSDAKYFGEVEGRKTSLSNWQADSSGGSWIKRNAAGAKYDGNFSFYPKSLVDTPLGRFAQNDLSCKRPRMPFLDEIQNFSSQVEVVGCSHFQPKFQDFCSTSRKEENTRKQEHPIIKRRDTDQRFDKMPEQGTADDIPMEIVELLAKNQYERYLADAETSKNTCSAQTVDFSKAYRHSEFNFFQQETSQKQKARPKNERSGIIKRAENLGPFKQKSVDYFCQADRNHGHFYLGQLEKSHVPAGFGRFIHHQETPSTEVQHPASSSSGLNAGQSSKWMGDLTGKRFCPTSSQASGPCYTCQSIPQQSKESSHLWSSISPNNVPFPTSIPQKHPALPTDIDMLSHFPAGILKEKINGDHDLKFLNQNVSSIGKQNRNFGSETLSKVGAEFPFSCKHNGIELNQKPVGSLDLYSNETIPAMHLLSLMDARLGSNAPVNLDANPKFPKRPTTLDLDPNNIPRLDTAAFKANNTMKHPMYDLCAKNQASEKNHEQISLIRNLSAIPNASTSVSAFRLDKNFKKTIDFSCQVSHEREKARESDLQTQNKGSKSQKRVSLSGNFGTSCGSVPVHSMQTLFFGSPDSVAFPLQFPPPENLDKHKLEAFNASGTVNPCRSSPKTEVCCLNRNPGDFSIPESGNDFMIAGEDLRFGKIVVPSGNEPFLVKSSGHKRQKKTLNVKAHGRKFNC